MHARRTHFALFLLLIALVLQGFAALAIRAQDTPPPPADAPAPPAATTPAPAAPAAPGADAVQVTRNAEGVPIASLDYPNPTPIMDVLGDYASQTGVTVSARGKAGEKEVRLSGDNLTPEQFLSRLADQNQLVWTKTKDGYEVWDVETYQTEVLPKRVEQKIFVPVHIKATDFLEAIKRANVLTPNIGGATVDPRTNQVIVTDLPEKLAYVQDLQNLIDVPQYTRTFYIRYANLEELVKKIDEMKLASEGGSVQVDPKLHLIIVRDLLPNIQAMEQLIEMLDVREPMRIYKLNSIGTELDELDALEKNLREQFMTPDAYLFIDGKRGLVVVRDTPEVQRDIERFLKVFNSPIPQVHIQAELLEVAQNVDLNYGASATFSEDLPAAVRDGLVSNFGAAEGASPDAPFGFINYRKEFPLITSGAGGFSLQYLSSHAKVELSAALSDVNTRLLLRPNLTVKNRETGTVNVVTNEPIATVVPLGENTNQFSVAQSTVPSGLTVEITPTITPTGLVEIKLDISNSTSERVELATGLTSGIETITSVRTNEDSVNTVMIIPDGETQVISGLIRRAKSENVNGIPLLVKIPYIGPLLFGSKAKSDRTRNLLFFITPTIVQTEPLDSTIVTDFSEIKTEGLTGTERPLGAENRPVTGISEAMPETTATLSGERLEPGRRFEAPLPPVEGTMPSDTFEMVPEVEARDRRAGPARGPVANTAEEMELMLREGGGRLPKGEETVKSTDTEEVSSYEVRPGPPVEATGEAAPPQQPPAPSGAGPVPVAPPPAPAPAPPVAPPAAAPAPAAVPAPAVLPPAATAAPTPGATGKQGRSDFLISPGRR